MGQQELYDRILRSLYDAAFDEAGWPGTAALMDAACGIKGNALILVDGRSPRDSQLHFARFCYRGQRRADLERLYFNEYWFQDERAPRLRSLPDGLVIPARDLFTETERRTSATYNEGMRLSDTQDSLNVRLNGPGGTHIGWVLADPIDASGWRSDRTRMVERLLSHVRQFMRVRHALVEAGALGRSLAGLLDATGAGVIHLDRRGRIAAANDRAVELLRQRDGLIDDDGVLRAIAPADDAHLQRLLSRALPLFGEQGAGGSMTVGRVSVPPRLVLHVSPVGEQDHRTRRLAALVLLVDPGRPPHIDPVLVASALGLTHAETSVAVMLATGCSLRGIAAATRRKESTVRWYLRRIFAKQGVSRQADVVRLVLSASGVLPP